MRDGIGQNRYLDEFVADLPRENVGILAPIVVDLLLDVVGGHLGLGSANDTRPDASGFLVAVQDLGHASVRHPQLSRNDARTHSGGGQFDDFQTNVIGQRTAIDEHATQLIDASLSYRQTNQKSSHCHKQHTRPLCVVTRKAIVAPLG